MEATGKIISVKSKYGKYGAYWGVTFKDETTTASYWFKRSIKDQQAAGIGVGQTITIAFDEVTPGKGGMIFPTKPTVIRVDGEPEACQHRNLHRAEGGEYICDTCEEEFLVRQLEESVA